MKEDDPNAIDHRQPIASFLEKWHQRWPEWQVVEIFIPREQRERVLAWFVLLQEWGDAAWGGHDPAPGLAKLAWWQDELRGWSKGARRHPLGQQLQPVPAPWERLADSLSVLRHRDLIQREPDDILIASEPLSDAIASTEQVLFGPGVATPMAVIAPLMVGLAVHQGGGQSWLAHWPVAGGGTRPRRLLSELARMRLQHADGHGDRVALPAWVLLWRSWRAARN